MEVRSAVDAEREKGSARVVGGGAKGNGGGDFQE
jgi:hypothetical protein